MNIIIGVHGSRKVFISYLNIHTHNLFQLVWAGFSDVPNIPDIMYSYEKWGRFSVEGEEIFFS